ncbi:MAG: tRNA uridine-5-carboxymethylaminomethyl(34) synthesis enzyme MnmG [Planctomycetia bacterium]|nr:tRNA uridine-5-carboxymethylaminomethyl(34) synthesis enzyme MnmG [Planctomycetia bacterium]
MLADEKHFDVIVIGGGHAGAEAALAAARLGCRVALVTIKPETICLMSCNPAIGGLAKGQIVREIDALGGEMAKVADETAIQFRLLNRSKGPAVRGPRCQCDRELYARAMGERVSGEANLTLVCAMASEILVEGERVAGIGTEDGREFRASAVVIATGTFLRGVIHLGERFWPAGRIDEPPASRLSESLEGIGIELRRLSTGTPPRLARDSVDFSETREQPGDAEPVLFSFTNRRDKAPKTQIPCHITYTTPRTHDIIRANLHRAPRFTGQVKAVGPRYCPNIETKVVRFADKEHHQIFLEPEGWDSEVIYLNGLSISMPEEVQEEVVHSIPGLERAEFLRHGYAIEYDFAPPTQLRATLESKRIEGLFCAGQINGTSGYEEAAGQGIVAGINAALKVRGEEQIVLARDEAYIGVLIDDLVTKGTEEPYRMFTGLAEYRLRLRHDNADRRLTPLGRRIGLIGEERWNGFRRKCRSIDEALALLSSTWRDGRTLAEILRRPDVTLDGLASEVPALAELKLPREVAEQVEIETKYSGYLDRQDRQVRRFRRMEDARIPEGLNYDSIIQLRVEAREKFGRILPRSLGQAARISGIGPADIAVLMVHLKR